MLSDISLPLPHEKDLLDFKYERNLGQGTYGIVNLYKREGEYFALKFSPNTKEMEKMKEFRLFETETEISQRVNHPNLVKCVEILECDLDNPVLVFKYYSGGTLTQFLEQKKGNLSLDTIDMIYIQLINALSELGRLEVMHRDIKPDNIFYEGDVFVLGDFGSASMNSNFSSLLIGTKMYQSPDILLENKDHYSRQVDVYSLGLTMYYISEGVLPREENGNMFDLVGDNLRRPLNPLISESHFSLLKGMTMKDDDNRLTIRQVTKHAYFDRYLKDAHEKVSAVNQAFVDEFVRNRLRKDRDEIKVLCENIRKDISAFIENKNNISDHVWSKNVDEIEIAHLEFISDVMIIDFFLYLAKFSSEISNNGFLSDQISLFGFLALSKAEVIFRAVETYFYESKEKNYKKLYAKADEVFVKSELTRLLNKIKFLKKNIYQAQLIKLKPTLKALNPHIKTVFQSILRLAKHKEKKLDFFLVESFFGTIGEKFFALKEKRLFDWNKFYDKLRNEKQRGAFKIAMSLV